jgi:hypothetical protein
MIMDREQETSVSRRSILTAASALLAGTAAVVPLPALAEENPDAELLRLGQEHDIAFARIVDVNRQPEVYDDDDVSTLCRASSRLEFAIQDIPAQTWAGVVVKARIAAEYTDRCSMGRILDDMLPSLIEDILRVANVTAKRTTPRCVEEDSDHGAV